jgi:chitin-binding protein
LDVKLPKGKAGHRLIYTIWQRSDSPEAFYSCADVIFGDGPVPSEVPAPSHDAGGPDTPMPTHDHGASPTPTHEHSSPPEHSHPATPDQSPTPHQTSPTPTNSPGTPVSEPGDASAPPWQAYQMYMVGELVSYNGRTYVCRQGHTSLPNWQPDVVPALWLVAVNSAAGDIQTWQSPVAYSIGDRVVYNGQNYRARQSHVSLPGWEPPNTPALWEPEQ